MLTKEEQDIIESVVTAFVIVNGDLRRAEMSSTKQTFSDCLIEWTTTRSPEFRLVFADTCRELAIRIAEK